MIRPGDGDLNGLFTALPGAVFLYFRITPKGAGNELGWALRPADAFAFLASGGDETTRPDVGRTLARVICSAATTESPCLRLARGSSPPTAALVLKENGLVAVDALSPPAIGVRMNCS